MESAAIKEEFALDSDRVIQKSERLVSKISPKYYKQAYRIEWESMPDFKGWLRGVPGEPNRAYCLFCQKSLHAHRLSLLKHTCTLKHTKAAQKNFALQTAELTSNVKDDMEIGPSEITTASQAAEVEMVDVIHTAKNSSISAASPDIAIEEEDEEGEDIEDNDVEETHIVEESEETASPPRKRMQPRIEMATSQPTGGPLSTHILDTAKGNPVGGLQVSLYKLIDGRWTHISEGLTNPDGRYTNFIQKADFTAGRYKLHFDVDRYFEMRKVESLYPFIEIVFDVKSPQDHYHVPLLLSPFGYTTYRGS